MNNEVPSIISGGNYIDERGQLDFFNNFDMSSIKRLYFTTHFETNVVRAWQGHKIESRWFVCVRGSFIVKLVKINDWKHPSDDLQVDEYELKNKNQNILFIPKGYANGFKSLAENSKLLVMSNYGFNEIKNDQVRFDQNKWTRWGNN